MTKTMCIAAAIKTVKDLEIEKAELLDMERRTNVLEEVDGEIVHTGPAYDFNATQCRLAQLDENIRNIRHAVNVVNATTPITTLGMTPDCVLMAMAQSNKRLEVLKRMQQISDRQRCESYGRTQAVFTVRQFDAGDAKAAADTLRQQVREFQMELDRFNLNTEVTFTFV